MKRLLILSLVLLATPFARADIRIAGAPVELGIDQIDDRMIRVQISPIDENGQLKPTPASTVLVPFDTTEKLRVRDLPAAKDITAGRLRVHIQSAPLTITINRQDGKLVQELL